MSRILRLFAIILLLVLIAAAWIWWNRPAKTDLASCVPADSLIYLESNSLFDVARTLTNTDAWRNLAPYYGLKSDRWQNRWLTYIARTTGIGSAQSVIAARAQVAFALLDLNLASNGDAVEIKSHQAMIVETHTSQIRMKAAIEKLLGDLAQRTYHETTLERIQKDNSQFSIWTSPEGNRKLVVSFDGTVAIIGNDEQSVSACLAARRGQRPSLAQQPEMEEMRTRMRAGEALAFGYVPSAKAPGLFTQILPLYLGSVPEPFQTLLAGAVPKVIGTLGWSAHSFANGIEDRYFMSLEPAVVARLRSGLTSTDRPTTDAWKLLPADTYSVTDYYPNEPAQAWETLKATLSSQVDVVTALALNELEKLVRQSYGIDNTGSFLKAIKPEILTARLDVDSERAVLVARVADENALKQFVARRFDPGGRAGRKDPNELVFSADGQFAAAFVGGFFLMGPPEDVRRCLTACVQQSTLGSPSGNMARLNHYKGGADNGSPVAVTYTPDVKRARGFVDTLSALRGSDVPQAGSTDVERTLSSLPYAETETRLGSEGFERRTRSPFGLFSTFVSFLPVKTETKAIK